MKRKVLVVDDDPLLADTTRELLELSGFEAMAAYDGEEALRVAEAFAPDVLLSDVVMPGINGVQLASALRVRLPRIQILLISGQTMTRELIGAGENEFELLAKPIAPANLIRRLRGI